jgi:putative Ca2+/H+ antiporter (TMEM165/GDT1 family)
MQSLKRIQPMNKKSTAFFGVAFTFMVLAFTSKNYAYFGVAAAFLAIGARKKREDDNNQNNNQDQI